MKTLNLVQGSPEWLAARRNYRTASEASAMMGVSQNTTRSELLRMKATGSEKEFSDYVQRQILDKGHEVEAKARPIAEKIIGDELFPATVTDDEGYLLASLDGMTMMGEVIFEHKQYNAALFAEVKAGRCPECHLWQVIQALVITGAEKCLFMTSDGTKENCAWVWVELCADDKARLVAGWKQYDADLADYVYVAPVVEVIGRAPDDLPALHIEVTGMVTASNLDAFKTNALAVFAGINRELSTDADFANAEKTVKWCAGIEDKLKAAKEHALSQTQSIDLLFKTIDGISAEARATRLELDKLVKARKETVRIEIMQKAQQALFDHMAALNKRLGGKVIMPTIAADFAGVMKGLKTVASLQNAVDTELARVKIESSTIADKIDINLGSLRELGNNHIFLFSDAQQLVMKANDDLVLLIKSRIADHEKAEADRIEREVQARLAEEQRKADEERLRVEREAKAAAATVEPKHDPVIEAAAILDGLAPVFDMPAPVVKAVAKGPTAEELVMIVAQHCNVSESVAYDWLVAGFSKQEAA